VNQEGSTLHMTSGLDLTTTTQEQGTTGSAGRMEQVISAVVDGVIVPVTGAIPWLVSSGVLWLVFAAMWLAFGAGLVWNQGGLDATWAWITSLPLLVQAVAWLLFLPVVAGLWIWETGWPLVLRLALVGGLAGWSLMIFLPRSTQG
jgi:hypothetical protein